MNERIRRLLVLCPALVIGCGTGIGPVPQVAPRSSAAIAQTCTALTIRGTPIDGIVCGGSTHAFSCSPGAIYRCRANGTSNNCTLQDPCPSGCLTNPSQSKDSCFAGTAPLALSTSAVAGGDDVLATVTLADAHPRGAIVNITNTRGDVVATRTSCNVPDLAAGATSATFAMPTAVVGSPTSASLFADISYTDAAGSGRELVSHASTVTLNPGGTAPPPPRLVSFSLSPSPLASGGVSIMDVVLEKMAPAAGVPVAVTSSDPSVASIIPGGQPFVLGGCTKGGGAETVQAAKIVAQNTTVDISASSDAAGQAPVTNPLTVTAGCAPKTCLDLAPPACSGPDGCGGTLACGCNFGQTCGGGGTPGVCGAPPSLRVSSLTLNPSSVSGGSSSVGTVTLDGAAPPGGAGVFLSSSSAAATVPQSVVVAEGATSANFTVATTTVNASTPATISAAFGGTQTATLTITTSGTACTTTTCAPQDAVLTVAATGRSGVTVVSKPAGLNVPVGGVGSASFASGTTLTLGLSDRTAIWSGACSTPRDTASCTFTISGNANVTANVQ